jgi:predicted small metal-binding protein
MAANTSGRKLECDCGYLASGEDDDELVAAVQAHASAVHGMTLSAELVLDLLGSNPTIERIP